MNGSVDRYMTTQGARWRYRIELPPDPTTGKRRQATRRGFLTKREADRARREAIADVDDGTHIPSSRLTVGAWLEEEWLPSIRPRSAEAGRRHRGTVPAATHERYAGDLRRYVIPRIGSVQLQALTAAMLDELYDELERAGGRGGRPLSSKTVANVAGALHKALADAVKRGRIKRSPADAVSPPTPAGAHTSWWSIEELRTFLRFVEEDELYAAWLLFATTGARAGEVAGLTWGDLDAGWMRVDWTLGHVGHTLTWKPRPKSRAGERTMALDPATVAALRQRKRVQAEARLLAGPAWQDTFIDWQGLARSGLVWTYGDGSPIHPKTLYERFLRLSAEAGLLRIRLHDVRHSYASAALASATGWHDSRRQDHQPLHVLPAADEKVAHTLASTILGRE